MEKVTRLSWEEYALNLAEAAISRSEDPYIKNGACVLREDHSVASIGYNGAPPDITINWEDRIGRRNLVVHAECNALRYCLPNERFLLIAVTQCPCSDCLKQIAAYGIKKVVFKRINENRMDVFQESVKTAQAFGIELQQIS